jgi:hypothetical protein
MDQENHTDRQRRLESARREIQSLSEEIHRMNQALLLDKQKGVYSRSTGRGDSHSPELLRTLKKLRGPKEEGSSK